MASPGLLSPLPAPTEVFTYISMDFIVGLPKSQGKDVIFVVVDRLTKYGHFMALNHPYSTSQVAEVFMNYMYKLHGFPATIVSDCVSALLKHFWEVFFKLKEVQLAMSTTYHI